MEREGHGRVDGRISSAQSGTPLRSHARRSSCGYVKSMERTYPHSLVLELRSIPAPLQINWGNSLSKRLQRPAFPRREPGCGSAASRFRDTLQRWQPAQRRAGSLQRLQGTSLPRRISFFRRSLDSRVDFPGRAHAESPA